MNVFFQALAGICKERLLDEKWLIAPSLRAGHQWLEAVTRGGQPAVNVRVQTLKGMALELAATEMAARRVKLLAARAGVMLIDRIWQRTQAAGGYLRSLHSSPQLFETIFSSIQTVRLAGMSPEQLRVSCFEVPAKAADLVAILKEYLAELRERGLIDYADALRIAAERLQQAPSPLADDVLVLLAADAHCARLERALLDAVAADKRLVLPVDEPAVAVVAPDATPRTAPTTGTTETAYRVAPAVRSRGHPGHAAEKRARQGTLPFDAVEKGDDPAAPLERGAAHELADAGLLRWLADPASAPQPRRDETATIFRAVGEANEVREVLRRCLEAGYKLDDVELLYTDSETYLPLIYETAARLEADGVARPLVGRQPSPPQGRELPKDPRSKTTASAITNGETADKNICRTVGLPVTFADGVPTRYARPGRALAAWLAWQRDGFQQFTLRRMIQDGLLGIPGMDAAELSFTRLAAIFRTAAIGWGRDRYLPKLDELIAALRVRTGSDAPVADEDGEVDPDRRKSASQRLRGAELLGELVRKLLAASPPSNATQTEVLQAAAKFLHEFARPVSEFDNLTRQKLLDEIAGMTRLLEEIGGPVTLDVWQWLASLPQQVRVGGSGPKPGHLHVASVTSGGHSGRQHTFIIGLDDSRFPGAGMQDPLLLDAERRRLSPELSTAADQLHRKLESFARLLARLRGTITLSFSCRHVAEDRDMFASPVLLAAYRILSGNRTGDQRDLLDWLPPAASFAPDRPERSLDESDWWLWRLCGPERIADPLGVVQRRLPHLERGGRATIARAETTFTPFDGWVPQAGAHLDPAQPVGPVMSAGRLQTIGACPLAYFFQYVLELKPPEEVSLDESRWLDPQQTGLLLHEVFYEFMSELSQCGRLPCYQRDGSRLREVLAERIEAYRSRIPPPSESVFQREEGRLQRAARTFLKLEEDFCKTSRPVYLEAAIGMPSQGQGTPLDTSDPVPFVLSDGRRVRVCGRIDRVDQLAGAANQFAIWDYKTGGMGWYDSPDPFRSGRIVQHVLYLAIAQDRLRQQVRPDAELAYFGFFFPDRGRGARKSYTPADLQGGTSVVQQLCTIAGAGCFAATTDKDDCKYCDYQTICRDLDQVTAASCRKLADKANDMLLPFRELRAKGR
jgi:ATP-dependent helicase/nuclease subunit B